MMKTICLLVVGCLTIFLAEAQAQQQRSSPQEPKIDLLHMWAAESELNAIGAIRERAEGQSAYWAETYISGNMKGVEDEFNRLLSVGRVPNLVQWIVDDEMRRLVRDGIFRFVEDESGYFKRHLRPEVKQIMMNGDKLYGVPMGIHVQNHIVYNMDVLEKYGFPIPGSWEELLSYGEVLQQSGVSLIGVSDESWQLRKLFLSILSSKITITEFDEFQVNYRRLEGLQGAIAETMDLLFQFRQYAHEDFHNLIWQDGTRLVESGAALVQVLGDYIIPEFAEGANISCHIVPESNYVLWGVDSIALTNTLVPEKLRGQELFTAIVRDPDAMGQYIANKGGIPVTTNIKSSQLNDCINNVVNEWEQTQYRIWMGGDVWSKQFSLIGKYLRREWNSGQTKSGDEYARELLEAIKVY